MMASVESPSLSWTEESFSSQLRTAVAFLHLSCSPEQFARSAFPRPGPSPAMIMPSRSLTNQGHLFDCKFAPFAGMIWFCQ